ncbi:MAG: periplasmic heavy metal sensor [Candidatus Zixiibacteriota bacterium]
MKWKLASIAAVLTLALAVSLPLLAQQVEDVELNDEEDIDWAGWRNGGRGGDNPGKGMMEELALTKDQQKKMDDMRSAHRKEMIPLRAQVRVKEIELQELFESDASLATVSGKIDEISKLKSDLAKKQAGHRIAMRQTLTPEQREIWDSRPRMMGMRGQHKGMMERGMMMKQFDGRGEGMRGRGRGL